MAEIKAPKKACGDASAQCVPWAKMATVIEIETHISSGTFHAHKDTTFFRSYFLAGTNGLAYAHAFLLPTLGIQASSPISCMVGPQKYLQWWGEQVGKQNRCGQSPVDFKAIPLTTRARCQVEKCHSIGHTNLSSYALAWSMPTCSFSLFNFSFVTKCAKKKTWGLQQTMSNTLWLHCYLSAWAILLW